MDAKSTDAIETALNALLATAEASRAPETEPLLALLARRLVAGSRLAEAAALLEGAAARGVRVDAAAARALAQAQLRTGDVTAAETTIRRVLKQAPADAETQRLLY